LPGSEISNKRFKGDRPEEGFELFGFHMSNDQPPVLNQRLRSELKDNFRIPLSHRMTMKFPIFLVAFDVS
jgi:hypothetical protein